MRTLELGDVEQVLTYRLSLVKLMCHKYVIKGTLHLGPNPFGLKPILQGIWVNKWAPVLQMGQQLGLLV
jgi:hypothetical protein